MSPVLSRHQRPQKRNSTQPGSIPLNSALQDPRFWGRHVERNPHGPPLTARARAAHGKTTPFRPRMPCPTTMGPPFRHSLPAGPLARLSNGGHAPTAGCSMRTIDRFPFEPGQGPPVPSHIYENARFRRPVDRLLQWRRECARIRLTAAGSMTRGRLMASQTAKPPRRLSARRCLAWPSLLFRLPGSRFGTRSVALTATDIKGIPMKKNLAAILFAAAALAAQLAWAEGSIADVTDMQALR